jgi:hypothetical protein
MSDRPPGDTVIAPARRPRLDVATAFVLWLAACAWALGGFSVSNDHFGRISPARQIARYHELPFRDFFDPGYFLTELSSAALQWMLGDNLLGELLLTSVFIATGTVIVYLLVRRVTGSIRVSLAAAVLALFAVPRPYDYDKVLFYPLGILLACRYAEHPTTRRAVAFGGMLVIAALFRYDTGVYLAVAAAAALVAQHRRDWRSFAGTSARLGAVLTFLSLPVIGVLHGQFDLRDVVDQAWTYGVRERARTEISAWPVPVLGPPFGFAPPQPRSRIAIRWAASVDDGARAAVAERLGLLDGVPPDYAESRTWSYAITDTSREALGRIVGDPAVEDTGGIERGALVLSDPEPWWSRAGRLFPPLRVRVFPEFWQPANASALLYNLCWGLPLLAAAFLVGRGIAAGQRPEDPWLWSAIALCLVTDALVLRDPVEARIGGVAGAPAILAAWLGITLWRRVRVPSAANRTWRARTIEGTTLIAIATVLAVTVWSLSTAGDWRRRVLPQLRSAESLAGNFAMATMTPPPDSQLPTGALSGLVSYIRACTTSDDRVFASWFVPELYFFAQRGFAGGMTVVFGDHWSEPRFQRRAVARLAAQSVPIVIVEGRSRDAFAGAYPLIARFLAEHYRLAGTTDFGNHEAPAGYEVLVDIARTPSGTDPVTMLPCFR